MDCAKGGEGGRQEKKKESRGSVECITQRCTMGRGTIIT